MGTTIWFPGSLHKWQDRGSSPSKRNESVKAKGVIGDHWSPRWLLGKCTTLLYCDRSLRPLRPARATINRLRASCVGRYSQLSVELAYPQIPMFSEVVELEEYSLSSEIQPFSSRREETPPRPCDKQIKRTKHGKLSEWAELVLVNLFLLRVQL